jgi:hypothetical protein
MNLIVQPASASSRFESPPELTYSETVGDWLFETENKKIKVLVPLTYPELWGKAQTNRPFLYVDRSFATRPLCEWQPGIWLDLRVWITADSERFVPDQHEDGDGVALSGGQFESNRSKH